ncbi:MAG: MATE family efflux transporter [Phyllobacterium sp.]
MPTTTQARFTTGSTMRHVIVMTATGSIGLMAIFIVDALNLLYISMLGKQQLAAAIGYAGTLMFFTVSVSIGLTIAASALVSRALGKGDRDEAARLAGAALLTIFAATVLVVALTWPFIHELIGLLGASGETRDIAAGFTQIVLPSLPIMGLGMGLAGILRGAGDAKRAMYVTLFSGAATAIFDPLFIFGFDLGVTGAAISTVLTRFVMLGVGLYAAVIVHQLVKRPQPGDLRKAIPMFLAIGIPAVLTQVATPVGNAFVTAEIARFGDDAVAGWAVIGRIVPVSFGAIFALSGAVGPILGQNYGAQKFGRIVQTMRDSLLVATIYVVAVWLALALLRQPIADLFGMDGEARLLIYFFCLFAAGSFLFNGALFVANAAFNNLGYPVMSTVFNWGRATLGVLPFVWVGSALYGAQGVLAGWGLGAVFFGVASVLVCFRVIARLERDNPPDDFLPEAPPSAQSPFTTGKAATSG